MPRRPTVKHDFNVNKKCFSGKIPAGKRKIYAASKTFKIRKTEHGDLHEKMQKTKSHVEPDKRRMDETKKWKENI